MDNSINILREHIHKFVNMYFNGDYKLLMEELKFEENIDEDEHYSNIINNYVVILRFKNVEKRDILKMYFDNVRSKVTKIINNKEFKRIIDSYSNYDGFDNCHNKKHDTHQIQKIHMREFIEYYIKLFRTVMHDFNVDDILSYLCKIINVLDKYDEKHIDLKISMSKMLVFANSMTSNNIDMETLFEMLLFDNEHKTFDMLIKMFEIPAFGRYSEKFGSYFKGRILKNKTHKIRDKLCRMIKRICKKHGITPDINHIMCDIISFMNEPY